MICLKQVVTDENRWKRWNRGRADLDHYQTNIVSQDEPLKLKNMITKTQGLLEGL